MSHSTTATSSYPLAKYSKSYPNALNSTPENAQEWQHFTNPSIRLVLDIKKGAELQSVRLRVLWSLDSDNDPAQREVVFEDVDLLTFSYLSLAHRPLHQQAQGLPLKAVYRDTIVGIRYLHPIEYKDAPTYRRFQITFLSSVAVVEFIQKISPVCPCKANPAVNSVPRMMNPPPVPLQSYRTASLVHAPSQLARSESMAPQLQIQGAQTPFSTSPSLPLPINLSSNAPTSQNSMPSSSPIIQSTIDTHLANPSQQSIYVSCNPLVQETQQEVLVKIPSPPTAVSRNENAETCVSPTTVGGSAPESPFLASLRESTDMYHLSRAQLEQLVGEVVREEGFAKLMEDLNSMWAVKAVAGV